MYRGMGPLASNRPVSSEVTRPAAGRVFSTSLWNRSTQPGDGAVQASGGVGFRSRREVLDGLADLFRPNAILGHPLARFDRDGEPRPE